MASENQPVIFVEDLKNPAAGNTHWFTENSARGLAGRCLLDAIEYLRIPKYPARYSQVVNGHAMRLVHRCLSDPDLNRGDVLKRMVRHIEETCQALSRSRQPGIPYFGDDFWDWASIINAIFEVRNASQQAAIVAAAELDAFVRAVLDYLPGDLTVNEPTKEWYGPAIPALVHRVLDKHLPDAHPKRREFLAQLKQHAFEQIGEDLKYRGRHVSPLHVRWHYGQVVAHFGPEAADQAARLADFSWLTDTVEKAECVFFLARVLQGAYAANDKVTRNKALGELFKCQSLARPLGHGLMGDSVKGSLNVLDALWSNLDAGEKNSIGLMLDELLLQHTKANTVGIVVAIPREMQSIIEEFGLVGAKPVVNKPDLAIIQHANFRVVICRGKSLGEVVAATTSTIKDYRAKWVIMPGIAGSLGRTRQDAADAGKFVGPDKQDLVIATSLAPHHIRNKVREEIANAQVPFHGDTWDTIPTDPTLFRLAHEAVKQIKGHRVVWEGTIVTRPGIMDSKEGKAGMLDEYPGGLAVEEEGYMMGIVCLGYGVPYVNIRGISDRAEGDKAKQGENAANEEYDQVTAARSASRLAVKVVELLSERW